LTENGWGENSILLPYIGFDTEREKERASFLKAHFLIG
jgi:hypothetical protein